MCIDCARAAESMNSRIDRVLWIFLPFKSLLRVSNRTEIAYRKHFLLSCLKSIRPKVNANMYLWKRSLSIVFMMHITVYLYWQHTERRRRKKNNNNNHMMFYWTNKFGVGAAFNAVAISFAFVESRFSTSINWILKLITWHSAITSVHL